jgi:hypothetical protein
MDAGLYLIFGGMIAFAVFILVWDIIAERVNRKARQNKS